MKRQTRFIGILLILVILLGTMSTASFAATINPYPTVNPSPAVVAAVIDNEIDRIYDDIGATSTLYFEFSAQNYIDLNHFALKMQNTMTDYLSAIFASNLVGEDYITPRCSFLQRTRGGQKQYFLQVDIKVHDDPALRAEMDRLFGILQGHTPREQVDWLYSYLHRTVTYDKAVAEESGTYLALMQGKGVCMGYTRPMTELCRRLNIPCFNVINDNHMWNCVYLNGKWWMIDITQNIYLTDVIRYAGHSYNEQVIEWAKTYFQNRSWILMQDIKQNWYTPAVRFCLQNKIFNGTSQSTFSPDMPMSRGMFVTVLGRMAGIAQTAGETAFVDVPKRQYYSGYVAWAKSVGIVDGVSPKYFAPNSNVTREQICKMMAKYCSVIGVPLTAVKEQIVFTDADEISPWAREYVKLCQTGGLVNGTDGGRFAPRDSTTRAQVAMILFNFCNTYK